MNEGNEMDVRSMAAGTTEQTDDKALAVVNDQRPMTVFHTDANDMDSADMLKPKLRLAQGLTPEVAAGEAKPGQWLLLGAMPMNQVIVVPLAMAKRRAYTVDVKDADGTRVVCESGDSITGVGDPGGVCATCPLAQWSAKDANGRSKPPPCNLSYEYIVYIPGAGPATLSLSKTGTDTAKFINMMAKMKGFGKFAVELGSKDGNSTDKRKSFKVATIKVAPAPEDLLAEASAFAM